jgi:hypothetical protein
VREPRHDCGGGDRGHDPDELEPEATPQRRSGREDDQRRHDRGDGAHADDRGDPPEDDAGLPPGRDARLDRPPGKLRREEQPRRVGRRPRVDRPRPEREPQGLLRAEEDDAGRQRGTPARGQAEAEPEQAGPADRQQRQLVRMRVDDAGQREPGRGQECGERGG